MLFNSLTFIVFFAIVLVIHTSPISNHLKKINLLVSSYIFYAAWNAPFVLLLWFSTLVDWFVARRIYSSENRLKRKALLIVSLCANLGVLGFFKYAEFVLENFQNILALWNIHYDPLPFDIILPVGISFYTFQTLSYTLDVYKGKSLPAKSFLDYALYVTFFPQLVAGPIVRSNTFIPQCENFQIANIQKFWLGIQLLVIGLFQKVVISDFLMAPIVDRVFEHSGSASFVDAWMAVFAFSVQIFCDFAGYSTCAIGVALALGFNLPKNFHFPYAALGFSDFWQRWHISLSSWLKDYLYIPLGGSRKGKGRTLVNLGVTMFLGGLWHGAAWTFVLWGLLHGFYLVLERLLIEVFASIKVFCHRFSQFILRAITFIAVCYGWMIFRAENLKEALKMHHSLFAFFVPGESSLLDSSQVMLVGVITALMFFIHFLFKDISLYKKIESFPSAVKLPIALILAIIIFLVPKDGRAFIYFQF